MKKYIHTLKEGVTPFDRFVSHADMKDVVDIPEPRKIIESSEPPCLDL